MAEKNFERWRRTAAVTIIGGPVARGQAVVPQVSPAALVLGLYPFDGVGEGSSADTPWCLLRSGAPRA